MHGESSSAAASSLPIASSSHTRTRQILVAREEIAREEIAREEIARPFAIALGLVRLQLAHLICVSPSGRRGQSLVPGGKPSEVPRELVDWVPRIRDKMTEGLCPKIGDVERCQWPATLSLEVESTGAKFTFQVFLDAEGWVTLPGSAQHWPEGVEVDNRAEVVLSKGGSPATRLSPGAHRIPGQFLWAEAPETLQVPQDLGLVRLSVRGHVIDFPRREENGGTCGYKPVERGSMSIRSA
ncbi:MAG: hypothetical protein QM784_18920 [Polyangiaceae bacterium]